MDFFTALQVSGSGLSAERARVNLASSNLANAEVTRTAEGGPYRRLDPVLESVPFDNYLSGQGPSAVRVSQVVADPGEGRLVYSPGHPDANPEGFVAFPNVNPIHEIVNLMSASRGYEANATAIETIKGMATRALDISR